MVVLTSAENRIQIRNKLALEYVTQLVGFMQYYNSRGYILKEQNIN